MPAPIPLKRKITIAVFFGLVFFCIGYGYYKDYKLGNRYKIARGTAMHITQQGRGGGKGITYLFYVNGKKYSAETGMHGCDNYRTLDLSWLIVNHSFYIAYDSTDPQNSILIINKEKADRFQIPVNDTILHFDSIYNCERVLGEY